MWKLLSRILASDYTGDYTRALLAGSVPNLKFIGLGNPWLRKCLLDLHEGIVKCWNFREDEVRSYFFSTNF